MRIIRPTTRQEFIADAARYIGDLIRKAAATGRCAVGLSGGSTPGPVYRLLSQDASIPWEKVVLFLVDERYVPSDHPDSNQKLLRETMLQGPAQKASLIVPDTTLPLANCIAGYEEHLRPLKPDVVILGMGPDGHIASLFPPLPDAAFGPSSVIHTTTDTFAVHDRISVTIPLLKRANQAVFLVSGKEKISLLETMENTQQDVRRFPAQAMMGDGTTWFALKE